ncbi:hypothetical protein PENDEC_c021G01742 [Penicillium decumbens]|uniref:AAA+ ATPase domain-containing protein n=1 Tax=Penicillium decumbens TaxID=69771 RepID=A0A1V6P602_PENDC|nr:hypothetical protein PENDEC_c021G01742 [Penicillium decumbens]
MYLSMQLSRLSVARPCRFVARRRYPALASSRAFHLSRQWLLAPNDPHDGPAPPDNVVDDHRSSNVDDIFADNGPLSASGADQAGKPVPRPHGSAVRRAMRNRISKQDKQLPPVPTIPEWFLRRNTISRTPEDQATVQHQHQVEVVKSEFVPESDDANKGEEAFGGDDNDPSSTKPAGSDNRYAVADATWDELRASVKAGMRLPSAQYANEPPAKKSHLVLQYPGNNGITFLGAVVKRLAHELDAHLVTLNAQDIAILFSELDLTETGVSSAIRSLGYEVYRPPVITWPESGEGEDGDEDISDIAAAQGGRAEVSTPRFITIEASRDSGDIPLPNWMGLKSLVASFNGQQDPEPSTMRNLHHVEQRWSGLLNEIIAPADLSAKPAPAETDGASESGTGNVVLARDTIVHIQDYREIQSTREGGRVIALLQKVIQHWRRTGSRILLVGSTSQDLRHSSPQDGSRLLQNVFDDNFSKTLVVTPAMSPKAVEKTFAEDEKNRTMDINIRHLQMMLRYRLSETSSAAKDHILLDSAWPLDPSTIKKSGIRERFWSYNQVHWVSTLALGSAESDEAFDFEHIRRGIELMDNGDRVTSDWLQEKSPKSTDAPAGQSREQLLASLRKTCNSHEKKLLNGVVDAKSIRTTFSDVHVPPETVDALKTLTSLSLIRPEAFTYGVLATDKIPGLLLYGPPGTGKTLLAKAVARESGATVLEVSGSEVYDMYVGEGEKNVKAIFTLAKKLSPCVVFIDEADAIFCSRTGASSRTSHRELINQFLREWDGMNDLSAFIMVATNRPFDLDDAVLRRLPRRLLVDLPTEEDRLSILKIHLKEEQLDPSVDLAQLAKRTPLYSGSDLKNLAVAAALACVREENAAAAQHQGAEPYQYPERRTLTLAHFERGMEEISASISEDMSSLSAIRKFDEQYGDRKGRRQKSPGWGFTPAGEEPVADSARVRT